MAATGSTREYPSLLWSETALYLKTRAMLDESSTSTFVPTMPGAISETYSAPIEARTAEPSGGQAAARCSGALRWASRPISPRTRLRIAPTNPATMSRGSALTTFRRTTSFMLARGNPRHT